jgi:hypothetical protein
MLPGRGEAVVNGRQKKSQENPALEAPSVLWASTTTADVKKCRERPLAYRRLVPVTTISACRPPQREQTSLSRQSRTLVSAPYRAAISAGSGST